MQKIILGVEALLDDKLFLLKGARVGLICHPASVDHQFQHTADLLNRHPDVRLTGLFGPQHGIRGETQDNMIEWEGFVDRQTGVPAHSLYGEVREPTSAMLDDVDVLVVDLQDVGTRVYTFIYTMALSMRAAKKHSKRVIVLDRPNPIGGIAVEGSLLKAGCESFVGMFPIPMRHGMTIGELALLFNQAYGIGCELDVVAMRGYERSHWFDETDARWIMPSPNIPTLDSATVYPGMVYIEGTKVSEGRGTTCPFELSGAPYIDSHDLAARLNALRLPGVHFRANSFQPTFQKHQGSICHGVQTHVTDRKVFHPVITGIALIKAVRDLYPDGFAWQDPPYEYVFDRLPFDVIAGGSALREAIEANVSLEDLAGSWNSDEELFRNQRKEFMLY
jgi:uncharacterized protein YbbC (DUF1343 family)